MRSALRGALVAAALTVSAAAGVVPGIATAQAAAPPAGIYQVWGRPADVGTLPYVKGGQIVLEWKQLQPARTRFDWSALDSQLAAYAAMGKVATVQVNSTTDKPAWIWNTIQRCGTVNGQAAPKYWDPAYMKIQTEMVGALATHLKNSPDRSAVALVRAAPNAIGTELTDFPSGTSCAGWSKDVRNKYYYDVMGLYKTKMLPEIKVALRTQLWTQWPQNSPTAWLGLDGAGMMGTASDIDPNPVRDAFDAYMVQWVKPGNAWAYQEPIQYAGKKHLPSWNYWRLLMELHKGVSYVAVYGDQLQQSANPEYTRAFDFVNRHAGFQASPLTAPGAWVALKLGTGRLAGNLTRFMTQIDPENTSTPLDSANGASIIGPTTERFGRFARKITGGTLKSTMYFTLDPAFKTGIALEPTRIRVRYLDSGTGSFEIGWGAGQSTVVTKTNTGLWQEAVVDVPAGGFAVSTLDRAADITVSALGTDSLVAHMVQVTVPNR